MGLKIVRTTDPETSHAAAESLTKEKIRTSQEDVRKFFYFFRNMTDTTLVEKYTAVGPKIGLTRQSESGLRTRRKELVDAGILEDTGEREVLPSGRKGIVWGLKKTL